MITCLPIRGEPITIASESPVTLAPGVQIPKSYLQELQAKGRRVFIYAVTEFVLKPWQPSVDLQPLEDDFYSCPEISDSDQEQYETNIPVQAHTWPRIAQSINMRLRSGFVVTVLCDSCAIHVLRSGRRISYQPELVSLRRYI